MFSNNDTYVHTRIKKKKKIHSSRKPYAPKCLISYLIAAKSILSYDVNDVDAVFHTVSKLVQIHLVNCDDKHFTDDKISEKKIARNS